jgi:hypothetical protein
MGSLEGRIRRLEACLDAHVEATGATEEARQQREWSEIFRRLSVEDLHALNETLDAAIERGEDSGTFEDIHEVADERGRRALDAYTEALKALRRGEDSSATEKRS